MKSKGPFIFPIAKSSNLGILRSASGMQRTNIGLKYGGSPAGPGDIESSRFHLSMKAIDSELSRFWEVQAAYQ